MTTREMIIQLAFRVASSGLRGANDLINRLRNGAGGADGAIRRMSAGMQKLNGVAGALVGTLSKVAAAMGVAFSAAAIKNAADEAMNLDNKLRVIYKDDEAGRRAMKDKIFDMANDARGSYTATGDLFYKVARTSETTGLSLDESARLAEIVSKGLSLSGADTGTAEGAILQLGQALSSGVLQGDELHALNEGAGALMQEMAKSMGVKIGDLKEMGKNGELTSDRVARAILASGEEIDRQFATHVPTIGQAMQTISNTWTKTMGDIQDRTNVFGAIAEGLISCIKHAGTQVKAFMDIIEGKAGAREEHPVLAMFADGIKIIGSELAYAKRVVAEFFAVLGGDAKARAKHPALAALIDSTEQIQVKIKQAKYAVEDFYELLSLDRKAANGETLSDSENARQAELRGEHPLMARASDVLQSFDKMASYAKTLGNTIIEIIGAAISGVSDAISSMGLNWESIAQNWLDGIASIQQAYQNLQPFIEAITPLLEVIAYVIGVTIVQSIYALGKVASFVFKAIAQLIEWVSALLGGLGEAIKWIADGLSNILTLGGMVGSMNFSGSSIAEFRQSGIGATPSLTNTYNFAPQYNAMDSAAIGRQSLTDWGSFKGTF